MVGHIRISDPHTIREVDRVRGKRGDKTASKTARDLITERLAILNLEGIAPDAAEAQGEVTDRSSTPATAVASDNANGKRAASRS